jgi:hypothetical protein
VTDHHSKQRQIALSAITASGYPFQTAIAALVTRVGSWEFGGQEIPWRDPFGDDRFLDLAASSEHLRLAIECKKTSKETYTFLLPKGFSEPQHGRVLCLQALNVQDSTRRIIIENREWLIAPGGPESAFCVVSTSDSGRDRRLLERDAQELIRATDALAFRIAAPSTPSWDVPVPLLYIPILVTNAPLFTASYDPHDIPLDTGSLLQSSQLLTEAPFVRFRKAFTSDEGVGDRTVLVVNASHLASFLGSLSHVAWEGKTLGRLEPAFRSHQRRPGA